MAVSSCSAILTPMSTCISAPKTFKTLEYRSSNVSTKAALSSRFTAVEKSDLQSFSTSLFSSSFTAKNGVRLQKSQKSCAPGVAQAGLLDFLTRPKKTNESKEKEREELKAELFEVLKPLDRGSIATSEDEEAVEEVVQKLEALNPTKAPLKSPSINGKWELKYTTSQTILRKNLPKLIRRMGPIYQCIDTNTLQAQNIETWPLFNQVRATLTPLSSSKVDVKFDFFKIFGLITVKSPENARGDLEITYLDDEMRIARGNRGNLFVLTMADPTYVIE